MLIKFKIKNYRSINKEICLNFKASIDKTFENESTIHGNLKTIGIFGQNASGKSNILKAFKEFKKIVIQSVLLSNTEQSLPNEFFKLNKNAINKPSLFEITFLLNDKVYIYGFEINKQEIKKEWLKKEKNNVVLFERTGQNIKSNKNSFKEGNSQKKIQETRKNVLFLSLLSTYNGETSKQIIDFLNNTYIIYNTKDRRNALDASFQNLNNEKNKKEYLSFLNKADFAIDDIQIREDKKLIQDSSIPDSLKQFFLNNQKESILERTIGVHHKIFDNNNDTQDKAILDFFQEESNGTKEFFALSGYILKALKNKGILLIDELDLGLHPLLSQYIVSIFNSKEFNPLGAQLIFTSHDASLIDNNLLRRDQIYFTEKNKYFETQLFSLFDLSERKDADFTQRYLDGRYGAIPYIVDLENIKFNKNI